MSISLKINIVGSNTIKTLRFSPDMCIQECCTHIFEKTHEGGPDHGLYQPAVEGKQSARWLSMEKTLAFYDINSDCQLDYKKKHRPQKFKLLDQTIKTQLIDESTNVSEIVNFICKKMGIKNPEEYSLMNSNGQWLNSNQILSEQGISETDITVLMKKFFFNDANIDRNDPVQLHLLFVQCRDGIIEGKYPTQREESLALAALQCQVSHGDYNPTKHTSGFLNLKEYLPLQWVKSKGAEKDIYKEYKKLVNMTEVNAKYRYVQLCRSLKTYGMTSFEVKLREYGKKKMVDHILGITRESMMLMLVETKEIVMTHPLKHIKRWAATEKSFTFDFGDHETEYLILYTPSPEQISQLISGYIEIIMKSRKDSSKVIEQNDTAVGVEESVAIKRGNVAQSSTFMGYGGNGGGAPQLSPSQQIPITDLRSALRATDLLIGELNSFKSGSSNAQQFTRSFTTLTPQQFKHQLITHTNAIATAANGLFQDMNSPPPSGGVAAFQQAITKRAQIIMAELNTVGTSAKNAAYFPDLASFSDEIINCATKLSESMSRLLSVSSTIQGDKIDDKGRQIAQTEIFNVAALATMMMAVCDNEYVTESSSKLLIECAKNVSAAIADMLLVGQSKVELIDDELLFNQIENAIKTTALTAEELISTTENLASTSCHAESRNKINSITQACLTHSSTLLTAFKSGEIPEADYNLLQAKVADIIDTIGLINYALDCSEQEHRISITANGVEVGGAEILAGTNLTEEFATVSTDLTNAIMVMRTNLKNPDSVLESYKIIAGIANRLIGCTKAVASRADSQSQQRLFNSTNAVFESVANLSNHCRSYIKNPEQESHQVHIMETAGHLQFLTQNMATDAGKIACITSLRDYSKEMIAHVSSLVSTSRTSAQYLPDANGISLMKSSKDVSEALAKLMIGIKKVVQDPKSEAVQMELLTLSQKQSLPPMNLVSASKRFAPKISDPNQKQKLIFASDSAAQSVQKLMKAGEAYKKICGHIEIEEALEAFDSTIADLETTEIAIAGGFLDSVAGTTREGAAELLLVAIKNLNSANNELVTEIRVNPSKLGDLVKETTEAATSVAVSAKTLICATQGKQAQKKLMGITKQLMNDMEQLIRASRSVATNVGDPASELLLDAATGDVQVSIASLVGSTVNVDCKELDEAASDIANILSLKLASVDSIITQPTEELEYYNEEILSTNKALVAATQQVVAMARSKNLKGLGASAKITAATLTTLINHAGNAIVLNENDGAKQAILASTVALGNQIVSLLDFSKALSASQSVEDHIAKVTRSLGGVGNNTLCDEAVDRIIEATRLLDQTILPDTSGSQTTNALEMQHQQQLLSITEHSKKLGTITSNIVAQKSNPDLVGQGSTEAAESVAALIEAAKSVILCSISTVSPDILLPAKNILDSTALIASNQNDVAHVITNARTVASCTSQLLGITKERAAAFDENNEQQLQVRESIVKSTQQLALATSNLARGVKSVTSKEPGGNAMLSVALKDLETATSQLLITSSIPATERGIGVADFEKLLATCRSVSTASSQFIISASSASSKPKDIEASSILAESASSMTSSLKDIIKVTSSMMPGVNFCEEAIEISQRAISDLSTMALSVAVGSFDGTNCNRDNLSHVESQEKMVEITKEIGTGINDLLKASRQSPEAIGISAKALSFIAPHLVNTTRTTLATTQDADVQNDLITEAKNVGDSILRLCQASFAASSNPSKETYQSIVNKCSDASEAMNKLVAQISSGVNLYKDLDESLDKIRKSVVQTSIKDVVKEGEGKSYQEYKEEISNLSKNLAMSIKTVVATDSNNLVSISTISKDIAKYISDIATVTTAILTTTSDQKIRDSIITNSRQVIQSTGDIINQIKTNSTDKANASQSKVNDGYRQTTESITRYLQSLKQGAIGEILSDAAIDNIRKVISDLDGYSLFAAAGQLENDQSSQTTMNESAKQQHLKNLQKDIILQSKMLIVSGSQLVGSSKGTQEHLGAATTKVASTVADLVKTAKDIASVLSDHESQEDILGASKALSISCQQMVLATKDAQRFKKDATAFRSLGKSAEAIAEAVGQFLTSIYTAIADAGKGIKELEKSIVQVSSYHEKPEAVLSNKDATAETLAQSARDLAKSSIDIVTSYQTSQEDLVKSSQTVVENVKSFIANSKHVVSLLGPNDEELRNKANEKVKATTGDILNLMKAVKDQDKNGTAVISDCSRAIAEGVQSLVSLSKQLPGGQNIIVEDDVLEDLEALAEDELMACARSIEEATARLLASRPESKAKHGKIDAEGIAATIVDASGSIAKAVAKLVHSAAVAQSKRREDQIATGSVYKQDPTWSNGLISAAKSVGAATHRLVEAAIKSAKGNAEEEELIATARAVAAATALLVSASRAKSGDNYQQQSAHHHLSQAAKQVALATQDLVAAAKAATMFEEQQKEEEDQEYGFTGSKVKELEQQMKILKLEKELESARRTMLNSRKQNYKK
ncbi:hypothetical protein DICPUDRAFT_50735 [Dictyostelium purpureum]|uniref:FERM domain-containing protein n=1 Tax=Dictyostelium purpureum TaxID=5786 RepID=F1A010_DICPU|nr:uncharacterized protein DICPUDRAFT_50735 [Dictyostelium purpureum]EGC30476.1 hypothetical protein DICPUDRAFT_50735 [Dictyostelium purpureum]|eukprot:XP_003293005.1 hypothetical protein DICPUDRAFT_50735 [Dictyostelium purpureum]